MSGLPAWAFRGAKVVWTGNVHVRSGVEPLVAGRIYVIRGTEVCPINGQAGAYVEGIHNPLHKTLGRELGYLIEGFRPAVEPKSEVEDVALFKHHLDQRKPVDA